MQNSLILYSTMFSFFFRFFFTSLNHLIVVVKTEFICMDDWVSSFSHHCVFINLYGLLIYIYVCTQDLIIYIMICIWKRSWDRNHIIWTTPCCSRHENEHTFDVDRYTDTIFLQIYFFFLLIFDLLLLKWLSWTLLWHGYLWEK